MSCVLCHDPEATPDLDAPLCKLHSDEFVEQIQEMQAVAYELPKTTTNNCQDCVKILGKEDMEYCESPNYLNLCRTCYSNYLKRNSALVTSEFVMDATHDAFLLPQPNRVETLAMFKVDKEMEYICPQDISETFKLAHKEHTRATIPIYSYTESGDTYSPKQLTFVSERDEDSEELKEGHKSVYYYIVNKENQTQKDEELFHYDSFRSYYSGFRNQVYIAGCMICYKDAEDAHCISGYLLMRILRTNCADPRTDAIVYSFFTDKAVIISDFMNWVGDVKYTDPYIIIQPKCMEKAERALLFLFQRGMWFYDASRGLPKNCRNPLSADHTKPPRNTTQELKRLCFLDEDFEAKAMMNASSEGTSSGTHPNFQVQNHDNEESKDSLVVFEADNNNDTSIEAPEGAKCDDNFLESNPSADTGITKQLRKRTLREPNVSSEASKGAESNVVDLNSTQSAEVTERKKKLRNRAFKSSHGNLVVTESTEGKKRKLAGNRKLKESSKCSRNSLAKPPVDSGRCNKRRRNCSDQESLPNETEKTANSNAQKGSNSSLPASTRGRSRKDVTTASSDDAESTFSNAKEELRLKKEAAAADAEEKLRLQKQIQKLEKELVAKDKQHKSHLEREQKKLQQRDEDLSSAQADLSSVKAALKDYDEKLKDKDEVKDSQNGKLLEKLTESLLQQRSEDTELFKILATRLEKLEEKNENNTESARDSGANNIVSQPTNLQNISNVLTNSTQHQQNAINTLTQQPIPYQSHHQQQQFLMNGYLALSAMRFNV